MNSKRSRISNLEAQNSILRGELRTAQRDRDHFREQAEWAASRHVDDELASSPRMTFLRRLGRLAAPWAMSLGFSGWFLARYEVRFCEKRDAKTRMCSYWPESHFFKFTLPEARGFARRCCPSGQYPVLVDLGTGKKRLI